MKTTFTAVTQRGTFTRTSQSHDAARPFTHVVLVHYHFTDERGSVWHAKSWCGSLALAESAALQLYRHGYETEVVPAIITHTTTPRVATHAEG